MPLSPNQLRRISRLSKLARRNALPIAGGGAVTAAAIYATPRKGEKQTTAQKAAMYGAVAAPFVGGFVQGARLANFQKKVALARWRRTIARNQGMTIAHRDLIDPKANVGGKLSLHLAERKGSSGHNLDVYHAKDESGKIAGVMGMSLKRSTGEGYISLAHLGGDQGGAGSQIFRLKKDLIDLNPQLRNLAAHRVTPSGDKRYVNAQVRPAEPRYADYQRTMQFVGKKMRANLPRLLGREALIHGGGTAVTYAGAVAYKRRKKREQ